MNWAENTAQHYLVTFLNLKKSTMETTKTKNRQAARGPIPREARRFSVFGLICSCSDTPAKHSA